MDLGAILLLTAVAVGVGLFVAIPFLEGRRAAALTPSGQEMSSLLAERDRLVTSLQELDFDYTLGKIPAEAYPAQRAELLQHGADVLRKMDALNLTSGTEDEAEARIEAAVAARRADTAAQQPQPIPVDDDIESRVAARRSQHKDQSGGFCPNCGKPVLSSDRFCPHCGKSIK